MPDYHLSSHSSGMIQTEQIFVETKKQKHRIQLEVDNSEIYAYGSFSLRKPTNKKNQTVKPNSLANVDI